MGNNLWCAFSGNKLSPFPPTRQPHCRAMQSKRGNSLLYLLFTSLFILIPGKDFWDLQSTKTVEGQGCSCCLFPLPLFMHFWDGLFILWRKKVWSWGNSVYSGDVWDNMEEMSYACMYVPCIHKYDCKCRDDILCLRV